MENWSKVFETSDHLFSTVDTVDEDQCLNEVADAGNSSWKVHNSGVLDSHGGQRRIIIIDSHENSPVRQRDADIIISEAPRNPAS
jgi:hypothetical protein